MSRGERAEETYEHLFGVRDRSITEDDGELMEILRRFIFGEVFHVGELTERERELITVVLLVTQGAWPQLTGHAGAALNVGVTPLELREAVYQCAPFLGFPRTLSAMSVVNEVFRARGVEVPLPDAATVAEDDRLERGREFQEPLYADAIRTNLAGLPEPFAEAIPRMLTEFCFGDLYTRGVLDLALRELLVLCILVGLGDTEAQVRSHARANLALGTPVATVYAALLHCWPYVGFPRAVNAIRVVQALDA